MKTKYFAYAAAAFILASCSNDEDFVPQDNLKDTPITIASVGVAELSTRAINTDKTLLGEEATLGLYVSDGQSKYKADHESYTYNTNTDIKGWEFVTSDSKDTDRMLFNGSSFDWIAYSPYGITDGATYNFLFDKTTFSVPTDGNYGGGKKGTTYERAYTVDGSQYDLLWGKSTSTSATLNLHLSHVLTKITVNITAVLGLETNGEPIASVKIGGSIPTGMLNLTAAKTAVEVVNILIEDSAEAADITALKLESPNKRPDEGNYVASYEALIIPQTAELKLSVKLDNGREFTKTLSRQEFVSGNHYIITLQVGEDKVTLDDITASSWTATNGGNLETE